MKATINLHDVTSIRVGEMQQLGGETHYRDIEIKTSDGDVFVIAAHTMGESAEIAVADRDEVTRLTQQDALRFYNATFNPGEPNKALRRAAEAHDQFTGRDGWIWHEGDGRCPVHPMDMVQVWYAPSDEPIVTPAGILSWKAPKYYQRLRDEDGVPYCSAEGLEDWAEYVASDSHGTWQFDGKPWKSDQWYLPFGKGCTVLTSAPGRFANPRQHWTETLRRVWRQ